MTAKHWNRNARFVILVLVLLLVANLSPAVFAQSRGDAMLAAYFRAETQNLNDACLAEVNSLENWENHRAQLRTRLLEMLGLDPLPERSDLRATITGTIERDGVTVEKLHFQSLPQLYVTANYYRPTKPTEPLPTILYVCGHGRVTKDGVSYGNKVHYHHHAAWFARNGYTCLVLDTLQLGEIEGLHHGTYREGMWWWNARGYTPAGVEAWNCVRALDYLQTRPEVDATRIGVTGRSGGGAYSWWIAAIDERVRVAVPVAGITDLANHVVDGVVEGHCDCMFMVNTYRWDYAQVAALVAPRPLLIANSDKDSIFPLDGVVRIHDRVRKIYELYGAEDQLGLLITEGPHQDTQELRVPAFRWFNRFLKQDDSLIDDPATARFEPEELKVFDELPTDQRNTTIQDDFTKLASAPAVPANQQEWDAMRERWMTALREKVFRGWPGEPSDLDIISQRPLVSDGFELHRLEFASQDEVRLDLYILRSYPSRVPSQVVLEVLDETRWDEISKMLAAGFPEHFDADEPDEEAYARLAERIQRDATDVAFFAPRGIGPTAWSGDAKKRIQIRRRFMLLGQTLDGMQVWDVRQALHALRRSELSAVPVKVRATGTMAGAALYATIFEPEVAGLELASLPSSHRDGATFLNVMRFLDMPQAVALAAERTPVVLSATAPEVVAFARDVADVCEWPNGRVQFVDGP